MIKITNSTDCCGCSACVQICPQKCISFEEDEQGFSYPHVIKELCVDCGICEKVCPCINQYESKKPIKVFAAINPDDEIRIKSSSGGIFSMIAEAVIADGGIVFGARFDENWNVIHDFIENKVGIESLRGSKYVQSRIGETYKLSKDFLNVGRIVLFVGTGCQIAGLKHYLRKDYENLLTIEIICHSVPSPLLWRKFLKEQTNGNFVDEINFRDKSTGWSHYGYSFIIKTGNSFYQELASGSYMKGLTSNLTTRPSCSKCPSREGKSGADFIIGDCWGIWDLYPDFDDNKGVSIIEILSDRGGEVIKKLNIQLHEVSLVKLQKYNAGLMPPHPCNPKSDEFFKKLKQGESSKLLLKKYTASSHNSILSKIKSKIKKLKNNRL